MEAETGRQVDDTIRQGDKIAIAHLPDIGD
jgi:hypothetical protein